MECERGGIARTGIGLSHPLHGLCPAPALSGGLMTRALRSDSADSRNCQLVAEVQTHALHEARRSGVDVQLLVDRLDDLDVPLDGRFIDVHRLQGVDRSTMDRNRLGILRSIRAKFRCSATGT